MSRIAISGVEVGDGCRPYFVAEIGQNHDGDAYKAIRLVGMAVRCGVDAVKFQLRDADEEFPPEVLDAPHPDPNNAFGGTYREHRANLDLTARELGHIQRRIQYNEWPVAMFATPCALSCVQPLVDLNCPAFKVASKDLTNLPLVDAVAQTGKPVILSTGMASKSEVVRACQTVWAHTQDLVVMACTSCYPCPSEAVYLRYIRDLRADLDCLVGFSDHTIGILAPALAVSLGACMVEKHVTLSRASKGTDHAAALEEDGLRRAVRDCQVAYEMVRNRTEFVPRVAQAARAKMARVVSL